MPASTTGITIQFVWVVSGWGGQANDLDESVFCSSLLNAIKEARPIGLACLFSIPNHFRSVDFVSFGRGLDCQSATSLLSTSTAFSNCRSFPAGISPGSGHN